MVLKVSHRFPGKSPVDVFGLKMREMVSIINQGALDMEADLVKASPVGVSGALKGGWSVVPASEKKPVAMVTQNRAYFLSVEMGRKPGKGISQAGQEAVALWAKRVLGLEDGRSFAFQLSQKYKAQGRPAQGFAGLARPGSIPGTVPETIEPIPGGLMSQHLNRIRERLLRV